MSKFAQNFSNFETDYVLNEYTNLLEPLEEPIDLQEKINSFRTTCLSEILDHFLPENNGSDVLQDFVGAIENLPRVKADYALRAVSDVDEIRKIYNIPDYVPLSDIVTALQKSINERSEISDERREEHEENKEDEKESE